MDHMEAALGEHLSRRSVLIGSGPAKSGNEVLTSCHLVTILWREVTRYRVWCIEICACVELFVIGQRIIWRLRRTTGQNKR
jgi:hypothetical protein